MMKIIKKPVNIKIFTDLHPVKDNFVTAVQNLLRNETNKLNVEIYRLGSGRILNSVKQWSEDNSKVGIKDAVRSILTELKLKGKISCEVLNVKKLSHKILTGENVHRVALCDETNKLIDNTLSPTESKTKKAVKEPKAEKDVKAVKQPKTENKVKPKTVKSAKANKTVKSSKTNKDVKYCPDFKGVEFINILTDWECEIDSFLYDMGSVISEILEQGNSIKPVYVYIITDRMPIDTLQTDILAKHRKLVHAVETALFKKKKHTTVDICFTTIKDLMGNIKSLRKTRPNFVLYNIALSKEVLKLMPGELICELK